MARSSEKGGRKDAGFFGIATNFSFALPCPKWGYDGAQELEGCGQEGRGCIHPDNTGLEQQGYCSLALRRKGMVSGPLTFQVVNSVRCPSASFPLHCREHVSR